MKTWARSMRRSPAMATWVVTLLTAVAGADESPPGDAFFGTSRVARLGLTLAPEALAALSPVAPAFPGAPRGAGTGTPADSPDLHRNTFGVAIPWTTGTLECDGATFRDVGVRAKGNYTLMASARSLEKSLKIDLDRRVKGQALDGLRMLNYHSGVSDRSGAREALSYAAFRAAGVPAPRTCFAELTLTVPGRLAEEFVGVGTVVEQIDARFLASRFGDGSGMLLKPEGLQGGPTWLGDRWAPYAERFRPEKEPKEREKRTLVDFCRLVSEGSDESFAAEIATFLDVDAFLRFIAANGLLANLDSYLAYGHNYCLYLDPGTGRFVFIPWDLDLSLATWPAAGTPEQLVRLSIDQPHAGDDRLLDRLLAIPEHRARYRALVAELFATLFESGLLDRELDAIEAALKEPLALQSLAVVDRGEGAGAGPFGSGRFGDALPPRAFIEKRTASVRAQLDGHEEGFEPRRIAIPGPPRR